MRHGSGHEAGAAPVRRVWLVCIVLTALVVTALVGVTALVVVTQSWWAMALWIAAWLVVLLMAATLWGELDEPWP